MKTRKNCTGRIVILLGTVVLALSLVGAARAALQDFTIIVLPDTQHYSESRPAIYAAQTQWIVDNKDGRNIVYVAHLGDIVEIADDGDQWANADAAMMLLEDPVATALPHGIPYSVLPGNHDLQPGTLYSQFFGVSRFLGKSYYGGSYPPSSNDNNFALFRASGMDFIVISLGMEPTSPVLDWADAKLKAYDNRRAIVVSHYLLETDGTFGPPGQATYDALKDNPNLFLMLSGHRHGEARRQDLYSGNTVHAVLADYQDRENGGNGWLRILQFSPENDILQVRTYSPTLNSFETDTDSQFELSYDMLTDSDNDGVADQEEWGSDGNNQNYDGNGDGTPDTQQDNVVSMHAFYPQEYVTLASPDTTGIHNVGVSENPSAGDTPAGVDFPYGFLGFTIEGVSLGDAATLTIYLPPGAQPTTYYKYGPTPNNAANHWYEFLYDGQTGAEIDGNVITLHFVDGKRGDDIIAADGRIIDQGGPGFDSPTSSTGGGGSGGGGCFMATAGGGLYAKE